LCDLAEKLMDCLLRRMENEREARDAEFDGTNSLHGTEFRDGWLIFSWSSTKNVAIRYLDDERALLVLNDFRRFVMDLHYIKNFVMRMIRCLDDVDYDPQDLYKYEKIRPLLDSSSIAPSIKRGNCKVSITPNLLGGPEYSKSRIQFR